jgi:site-specific DNA recombinase
MAVVVYVRISSDRTGERAGVDRQTDDCLSLCERLGLENPTILTDNDVSAYSRRTVRPGWRQLVAMMERREVEAIVAWHSDRLYRRSEDLNEVIRLIESYHVDIHTVTEGDIDLSTASGRLQARLVGAVAEHESEHKSERIIRKHQEIAAAGRWKGGGPRPFGYERDGVTIEPVEAAVAQEAVRRIQSGNSTTSTARWASEQLGRPITQRALVRSLTTPHIAGMRIHWPQREREAWEGRRRRGEVIGAYPPNFIANNVIRGTWPAVLEESDWRELLALFEARRYRKRGHRSLLAGVLRCGLCGKTLGWGQDRQAKTKTGTYAVYRCISTNGGCAKVSIAAVKIEPWLVGIVTEYAQHFAQRIAIEGNRDTNSGAKARNELLARLDDQAAAYGDGDLTRAQFVRNKEAIERQLAELGTVGAKQIVQDAERRNGLGVLSRWSKADDEQRAAALRALVRTVTVFPAGRGSSLAPEYRAVVTWVDDPEDLPLEELRSRLPARPPARTDAERREIRNAYLRRKYAESRAVGLRD